MSVTQDRARTSGEQTFDSLSPATGEVVATLPVHGEAEVREAVQRARKASQWWGSLAVLAGDEVEQLVTSPGQHAGVGAQSPACWPGDVTSCSTSSPARTASRASTRSS